MNEVEDWLLRVKEREATLTVPVRCVSLGGSQYRLDSIPEMVESVRYGDVFEADAVAGVLQFQRVVIKSAWNEFIFQVATERRQNEAIARVLEKVKQSGGISRITGDW